MNKAIITGRNVQMAGANTRSGGSTAAPETEQKETVIDVSYIAPESPSLIWSVSAAWLIGFIIGLLLGTFL